MNVHERVRARRPIAGMSAILLPFTDDGAIDWHGFEAHLVRTVEAGLVPAVNMDTGFGPILTPDDQARVLKLARAVAGGERGFVAGAHVTDQPRAAFDVDAYRRSIATVVDEGGTPILFPSYGLQSLPETTVAEAHVEIARDVNRLLAFELGPMFHPAGRIFTLDTFVQLLDVPAIVGLKHSSLDRALEWDRLAARDRHRPDFLVLTGNDLAIDMVVYGSDYLLGLSTFAPDAFAARDAAWAAGDEARFWAINDVLQYLGRLAFRAPVPGYRHDAAMFLRLRGWIDSDRTHETSPERPASDRALLASILDDLRPLLPPANRRR
jgi:dihydrodipicolinate synthase/N-acetylneuraminate lyase